MNQFPAASTFPPAPGCNCYESARLLEETMDKEEPSTQQGFTAATADATTTTRTTRLMRSHWCGSCGEHKLPTDFPLLSSMRRNGNRHCRFCSRLRIRGLRLSGMSSEGDSSSIILQELEHKINNNNKRPEIARRGSDGSLESTDMDISHSSSSTIFSGKLM